MRTLNTDLIEKIFLINDRLLKYANAHIFNEWNLTATQFNILWEIMANQWLKVNDLKEKMIVSAPALSQILNRMEKSWLIVRKLWINDKRMILVRATEKWSTLYQVVNEKYISLAETKLGPLADTDKKNTLKFLGDIEKIIL